MNSNPVRIKRVFSFWSDRWDTIIDQDLGIVNSKKKDGNHDYWSCANKKKSLRDHKIGK